MTAKSATKSQENTWAMVCHLSTFIGLIFPLGNILAPLVLWLVKREEMEVINYHAKQALNFQISMTIYILGAFVLSFVLIGLPLMIGLLIADVVLTIKAAIAANNGQKYTYPLSLNLIK